jgi:hypothetical protein
MIQTAFNSLISSNTLLLEEAKGKIKDSVEKEFKTRIEQELSNPETIQNILKSQNIRTIEDLQLVEAKFNQLKTKCNFIKNSINSKIDQINAIKNKINKIDGNFSKLDDAIQVGNEFLPTLNLIITSATISLGFFTGLLSNALTEKKINDGLEIAKGKVAEFNSVLAALKGIKSYIGSQTNSINNQIDPALNILNQLKLTVEQNCNYIDTIFLQTIAKYSELLDSDTENPSDPPTPQFDNPEEILDNLENSNKDKFFVYLKDNKDNTGYKIIKR